MASGRARHNPRAMSMHCAPESYSFLLCHAITGLHLKAKCCPSRSRMKNSRYSQYLKQVGGWPRPVLKYTCKTGPPQSHAHKMCSYICKTRLLADRLSFKPHLFDIRPVKCRPLYVFIMIWCSHELWSWRPWRSSTIYSGQTLDLIPSPCFIFESCCFADSILYLLVRGFRQNLKIQIFETTPIRY